MANAKVRVMVAGDMLPVIKRLSHLMTCDDTLELAGTAATGYEAIALAAKVRPDVVMMDAEMETRLAGVYACREILKVASDTRIVLMLDKMDEEVVFRAFQNGAHNVMMKTSGDTQIQRAILQAYQRRKSLDTKIAPAVLDEFQRLKTMEDSFRYLINVIVRLTPSELEILKLLSNGIAQRDVAKLRFIEPTTLKTHITHILQKFDAPSVSQVLDIIRGTGFFSMIQ